MCLTAKNFGLQEENINISTERERQMDRKREKGERMQCFMKKDDKGPIDEENVETTTSVLSLPHWPPFC